MWGIGVTSLIMLTSSPAACSARIAASRPEPGPFTYTSTVFSPCSIAALAAVSAAVCAANGVDFLEPLKPRLAGACPAERVTLYIGNGHDGIVESGLDMSRAAFDILASHGVCGWRFFVTAFAISVIPPCLLLLVGDCLLRSLAGTRVGLGALSSYGQALSVTHDRGSIRFRSIS